jgi:thioesterase domain-containing protein
MQTPLRINDERATRAARLERYMHDSIPLVRHMHVRVAAFDGGGLTLSAPLAPNINHEQTAFGVSLAGLATLACWGLLWLQLEDHEHTHIVVNESHLHYLRPVNGELRAHCPHPPEEMLRRFLHTLARRGKARVELKAEILQDGQICTEFQGAFVAYRENGS